MNRLLLKTTRQRAQARLYESSCLAHRVISNNEQALINAISECETLDGLTTLTDNLEKLVRNPTELLIQFPLLSSKLFTIPPNSSCASTMIVTNNATNISSEEDDSMYEFMSLYESEEVVNISHLKDAADTVIDELVAANAYHDEEISKVEPVYEPDQLYYRPNLPVIETDLASTSELDEHDDATTKLPMKSFMVSDTTPTKRKNKSPKNGDGPRTSPDKCDGEKKRGRPPISPFDRKPKVKKVKSPKKVVYELSDCEEQNN